MSTIDPRAALAVTGERERIAQRLAGLARRVGVLERRHVDPWWKQTPVGGIDNSVLTVVGTGSSITPAHFSPSVTFNVSEHPGLPGSGLGIVSIFADMEINANGVGAEAWVALRIDGTYRYGGVNPDYLLHITFGSTSTLPYHEWMTAPGTLGVFPPLGGWLAYVIPVGTHTFELGYDVGTVNTCQFRNRRLIVAAG